MRGQPASARPGQIAVSARNPRSAPDIDRGLALLASMQELLAARVEAAVKGSDEGQRLRAQDRLELRIDRSWISIPASMTVSEK